eukprot:TRINITY_DN3221_c0_g4_i2.p1 TRINITY_DN3221_c0_g4~~TRINITY_DN3221_c0_g4_i2.p1  ORF type:complete len:418 (-),score=53.78 TRINITY_DN3221_c0_g4_i2:75-1328(-)
MREKQADQNSELTSRISIPRSLPCKFFEDIFKRAQEMNSVLYASTLPSATGDNERSLYRRLTHKPTSDSHHHFRNLPTISFCQRIYLQKVVRDNLITRCKLEERKLNTEAISKIIFNDKGHIVSTFKDYLIFDEFKERLRRFMGMRCSAPRLKELTKKQRECAPFRFHWKEYKALEKAESLKSRMKNFRQRTDRRECKETSTLLGGSFRRSLVREDLSSSRSKFPASSLSSLGDERQLEDLLAELAREQSAIRRSNLEEPIHREENSPKQKKLIFDDYLSKVKVNNPAHVNEPKTSLKRHDSAGARNFETLDPKSSLHSPPHPVKNQLPSNATIQVKVNIGATENVAHTLRQRSKPRSCIEAYRTIIKPKLLGEKKGKEVAVRSNVSNVHIKQVFLSKDAFNRKLRRNANNKKFIKI